ncbi:MAG: type-F conjugative transfer system protein TraW [Sphingomonadales bacterium]|nr:type-F conjugative transfer system protein TraW [Sphingomonadales bacterium]
MRLVYLSFFMFFVLYPSIAEAKDYGTRGKTFVVTEVDLLKAIASRLRGMNQSGEIARLNEQFKQRAIAKINRPVPVAGLSPAVEPRSYFYDPTMVFGGDVKDDKGKLIVRKGQSVNPLDLLSFNQTYVFFDADRPEEISYVTSKFANEVNIKLIMVRGAPIEAMRKYKRRFYFDQTGYLTGKLGVKHTPAVMRRDGNRLKIEEVPL